MSQLRRDLVIVDYMIKGFNLFPEFPVTKLMF